MQLGIWRPAPLSIRPAGPFVSAFEPLVQQPATELDERILGSNRDYPLSVMCHRMAKAVQRGDLMSDGPSFVEGLKVMQVIEAAYVASTTANSDLIRPGIPI